VVSIIPEKRMVEFSASKSLGELYLIDSEGKTQFHGDAKGKVEVPAGQQLSLYYSYDPAYGCSLLHDVNASSLHSISFLGSEIADGELAHVGRLTGLRELDISCTHVGDEGVAHLRQLKELRKLNLSSTLITNFGVAYITALCSLEELVLDDTDLGDDALASICQLGLRTLSLSFTEVSDKGLSKLKEVKTLEMLRLNCTDIGDDGLLYLGRLVNLKELWLRSTQVSYPGLVELTKWLPNCEIII
jgi:Leucine-rich repeat (LRR) protein